MDFFFNDTATTEIYTLSLHDALPISLLFILPGSHCGSVPHFIYCPFLAAAVPLHFILPISRCGSARAFYNYQIGRAHV